MTYAACDNLHNTCIQSSNIPVTSELTDSSFRDLTIFSFILLVTREDIFGNYTLENFEKEFESFFDIRQKTGLDDSERILYLMEKKM